MKLHRSMKRSKTTALLLMSTAPLWLSACGEEKAKEGEALYTSVEACIEATGEPSTCRDAFKQASAQAAETAPQYANVEECAKDYPRDQCVPQQTQSGGSFIGPMMAGFFLGRMLGGNNAGLQSQPAFKDNTNNWAKPTGTATTGTPGTPGTPGATATPGTTSTTGSGGLATASRIGQGKAGLAPVNQQPNQPSPNKATTSSRSGFGARAAGARGAAS